MDFYLMLLLGTFKKTNKVLLSGWILLEKKSEYEKEISLAVVNELRRGKK